MDAQPGPAGPDRRWTALVVIAVAQLMTALDATIVNIALPSTQRDLGFTDTDRQWVITAYTVAFAGLLLLGGRIADRFGRRRAFLTGLAGFALASAIAGAAPDLGVLLAGRALQGGFAAILAPAALSMIGVTFRDPRERGRAFGVYGAVASSGAVIGLILGGVLTGYASWRWCLYVNIVVAAAAFLAGWVVLPAPPPAERVRIDALSAAVATGGLAALVYGCAEVAGHGWTSVRVLLPLVAGAIALAGFAVMQTRRPHPLLPLRLVADRDRAGAYLAVACAVVGSFGMFLMLTYLFQVVLGYSPLRAGLAFLPLSAAVAAGGYLVAGRLLPRLPARAIIVPGLLAAAAGLALLTRLGTGGGYLTAILPAEVLLGVGMGAVFTPAITVVTAGVDPRHAGVAAAVANTAMQVGGSIGVAVLNTIAVSATRSWLAVHGAGEAHRALAHGLAAATTSAAVLLVVAAAVSAAAVRTPRPRPRLATA